MWNSLFKVKRCVFLLYGSSPSRALFSKIHNYSVLNQCYGFSSSHVQMWELDPKEGWVPKNWCFRTVVPEKTLESLLDNKEIKPVNPSGNQPWICIGGTDAETEALILWSPDEKSRLTGKVPDAGKDWGHEEKGVTEDQMVGWHHWLDGYEFEQVLGVGDGQGSLACCSPWGCIVRQHWVIEQQQNTNTQLGPCCFQIVFSSVTTTSRFSATSEISLPASQENLFSDVLGESLCI